MGSVTDTAVLPDASSESVILTHPTDAEKVQTWTQNFTEWGGALSLEDYLERESYLTTIPLSANGGMVHWILTDATAPGGARRVLASCESLRKRALVADGVGNVREGIAYGIASVYTAPEYRGRRYASRMLRDLSAQLAKGVNGDPAPVASALWSDIGKSFYAKLGWLPFPSLHAHFVIDDSTNSNSNTEVATTPITYDDLESYCKLDEALLRKRLAVQGKVRFAFIPDQDIMKWHLYRDDYIVKLLDKDRAPCDSKGAVAGAVGQRVWAIWSKNYPGDMSNVSKNTLYILRLVVEDEAAPQEELQKNFQAILGKAKEEAKQWKLGKVDLWNPDETVKKLVESSGMTFSWVEREKDSIPSLMWYGEEATDQVSWAENEKYCWC